MSRVLQFWMGEQMQWQLTWNRDSDTTQDVELVREGGTSMITLQEAAKMLRTAYRVDKPEAYFRDGVQQ